MTPENTDSNSQQATLAALRESEERWKSALEGAGEGMWDWDVPTGRVIFSKRWKALLGYGEEEIEDRFEEWESRLHPEDREGALGVARNHLEGRSSSLLNEFRMRCKDGTWKWMQARGTVMSRDEAGNPVRVIGTQSDISAQKAAKQREATNLRLIVEDAPLGSILDALVSSVEAEHPGMVCGVMLVQPTGGTLDFGSGPGLPQELKQALKGTRIDPEGACGGAAVHFGVRVIVPDIRLDARWEPSKRVMEKAGLAACWAEPVVGSSGRVRGAFLCFHPEAHTPGAHEIGAITSAAQLAALAVERDEEKQRLRRSEERYRRIVETAEEGILSIDAESRVDFVNPKMLQMLGLQQEEILGKPFVEILDVEGRAILEEKLKLRRQGFAEQFEFRFPRRDGTDLWTFISTNPIMDEKGAYLGALGMFTDITQRRGTEAALRDSEARYARAMKGTSEGLWDWNILTGEDYLSPRWKEMLGYQDEDLPNQLDTFRSLLHPDDKPRVMAAVQAHLEHRVPYDVELRLRTKEGDYRWLRARGEAERNAEGTPVRMAGSISDITAKKQAEMELQMSEKRFRAVVEQAAVGVTVIDSNTGRFLSVNQRACDIAKLTREEMLAGTFMQVTHPEDLPHDMTEMAKLKAGEIRTYRLEKRCLHRDGSITWIHLTVSPMWQPGEAPTQYVAVVEDISERKQAEALLRESEERFRVIFEQAAVGVAVIDSNTGKYLDVNQRHCDITHRTREEVLRSSFMDLTHPDDHKTDQGNMAALQSGAVRSFTVQKRYMHPDGNFSWVNVAISPIWRPGEPVTEHIAVVEDITQRKLAEQALRESEERLRATLEIAPVVLFGQDMNLRYVWIHNIGHGMREEDVLGKTDMELLPPASGRLMTKFKQRVLRSGLTLRDELEHQLPDGTNVCYDVIASPDRDETGALRGIVCVALNITERRVLEQKLVEVTEREQQRIGHELHDDLCQRLASMKLRLELVASSLEEAGSPVAPQARQLWAQLKDATQVARNIAKGLSPIDAHPEGLVDALATLMHTVETLYEVPCFFHCPEPVLVENRAAASHILRIAQEMTNNAARHAKPERIDVRLRADAEHLRLEVENDGVTFREPNQPGDGLGLRIMRFRADAISAVIQFLPRAGGEPGTLAVCQVPQAVCNPSAAAKPRKGR